MATLGSLAVVARVSSTERFLRSSRLNQTRIHPPTQVVLKNHTRDLDLFDRVLIKLPVNPAGYLQPSTSLEFAPPDGLRTACFNACAPAQLQSATAWIPSTQWEDLSQGRTTATPARRQKEYQCQES
jgi:hypothetical protein